MAALSKRATRRVAVRSSQCGCRCTNMDKSKINILVVDDERGLCAGVQEALRREGYTVDAATDVDAVRKLVTQRLYNLVITDVKMPELDGLELLRQVKARSRDTQLIL